MSKILKAPFPYFGGKSRVASFVWERFGRVQNYVEPFFGSGAVLLGCPWPGHIETVNDADGLLCNLWRAIQADPEQVAYYADYPVSEIDLHSRHRWLVAQRADVERLLQDPDWYDAKIAGWWVWGISQWIGSGWCNAGRIERDKGTRPQLGNDGMGVHRKRPSLGGPAGGGSGILRASLQGQIPHVGNTGRGGHRAQYGKIPSVGTGGERGVHRAHHGQLPHLGNAGTGDSGSRVDGLYSYLRQLADRLRRVRITCGDWVRICGPSVTWRHGITAVFLDPPYERDKRADVYSVESDVFEAVRAWAVEEGANPLMRIALCGYSFDMPEGWEPMYWKAAGGYGSQGTGRGRENASREVVWFSPHCINELPLFRELEAA